MMPSLHGPSARPAKVKNAKRMMSWHDVEQLMGHQAVAYVTKILNTNEAILTESGRRENMKEYFMIREKAVLAPVELDSIESDALVAKGKLILCLKSIENDAGGQIKARLVAMGNVLFDKHMSVRRDAALHDLWSRSRPRPRRATYPRERRRTDG